MFIGSAVLKTKLHHKKKKKVIGTFLPQPCDPLIGTFSSFLLYSYHSVNDNFAPLAYFKQCRCWAMA